MISNAVLLHKSSVKPSMRMLGDLIKLVEQEVGVINSYSELAELINGRFNVEITEEDIYKYNLPQISEQESELIYKQYGY